MKEFFFDTNALMEGQEEIFKMYSHFYISSVTIRELENIKVSFNKDETAKYKARNMVRLLKEHRSQYNVILFRESMNEIIKQFDLPMDPGSYNDSKILACAYFINRKNEDNIIFVTNDLLCGEAARQMGLVTDEFISSGLEEYSGFKRISFTEDALANFYQHTLYSNENKYDLIENQYLIINDGDDIYKWKNDKYEQVPFRGADSNLFGKVKPLDPYQKIAMDSLYTNKITLLRGAAGSGKSYLAIGYMFHLLEKGKIDKIVIFCNTVATKGSAKLGFYPGTKDEKLLDSQIGNFLSSKLGSRMIVEDLIAKEKIILLPMSDIRGYDTTGMNAAIYITEAQNLDRQLIKLALQRIGEDSICILDGDNLQQVDLAEYAGDNNGIRRVSHIFKGHDFYGETTLQQVHRSKIAELAQQI